MKACWFDGQMIDPDEAVILNRDGFGAEGTVANLFIVVDGELLTPPVVDGALEGITTSGRHGTGRAARYPLP